MKIAEKHRSEKVFWGREPEWDGETTYETVIDQSVAFGNALNWYSKMSTPKQQKKWLLEHIKRNEISLEHSIEKVNDQYFTPHGAVVRIIDRGAPFDEIIDRDKIYNKIATLEKLAKKESASKPEETPEDKLKSIDLTEEDPVVDSIVETIEVAIDSFILEDEKIKIDFKALMESKSGNRKQAKMVAAHYLPLLEDIRAALAGDKELKQSYAISVPKMRQLEEFLASIIRISQSYVATSKAPTIRKPRRKKVKTPLEQTKSAKYCREFTLDRKKFTSIPIKKIVGAKTAIVYDTKYNKLGVYNAENSDGFTFKGSTLQNFKSDSVTRKIRPNKQKEALAAAVKAGKVAARKLLAKYSTAKEQALTGRFNANVIILKVF